MDSTVKYPAPLVNPETQPFWDATVDGKLLIKRCAACGEAHCNRAPDSRGACDQRYFSREVFHIR